MIGKMSGQFSWNTALWSGERPRAFPQAVLLGPNRALFAPELPGPLLGAFLAKKDDKGRHYLPHDGEDRKCFPTRIPKTVSFGMDRQYEKLYGKTTVDLINSLHLARYGLAHLISIPPDIEPSPDPRKTINTLSTARGSRKGFCRTNLLKRLESSGHNVLLSVQRHLMRNYVFLYALENGQDIPVGHMDEGVLNLSLREEDEDVENTDESGNRIRDLSSEETTASREDLKHQAGEIYRRFSSTFRKRFKWLPASYFTDELTREIEQDNIRLETILGTMPIWNADEDLKLAALADLAPGRHPDEKILVFSQYADTVGYLTKQMRGRGLERIEGVTGNTANSTDCARRFSPRSNAPQNEASNPGDELRVLICTDVLSERQNLQDSHIVVNYDLPWAIIHLIQRGGRVDRIGQESPEILCYSFLPAPGIEEYINLRKRMWQRLR